MRQFDSGATRDNNADKYDYKGFLSAKAIRRFGQYMHQHRKQADGSMRGSDNWKLGIPIAAYTESFVRHTIDFMAALEKLPQGSPEADELACAIWFNVQGYLHEREKLRENVQQTFDHIAARPVPAGLPSIGSGGADSYRPKSEFRLGGSRTSCGPGNDNVLRGKGDVPRGQSPVEAVTGQTAGILAGQGVSGRGLDVDPLQAGEVGSSEVGTGDQLDSDRGLLDGCF